MRAFCDEREKTTKGTVLVRSVGAQQSRWRENIEKKNETFLFRLHCSRLTTSPFDVNCIQILSKIQTQSEL